MGMQGFAEKGAPEGWDMAVGTVRGFRWWQLVVPLVPRYAPEPRSAVNIWNNPCLDVFGHVYSPMEFGRDGKVWDIGKPYGEVNGMHGGTWQRRYAETDGRYKAGCTPHGFTFSTSFSSPHTAIPSPECGCGFWAYWNGLPVADFDCAMPVLRYSKQSGYSLNIPVGGMIEGSGHTIIGERGFRCEYAKITDLAVGLDGRGAYYDQEQIWQTQTLQSYTFGSSPAVSEWGVNPKWSESFLDFVYTETGIAPEVITSGVKNVVTDLLGSDFRWHGSLPALLKDARRDENYVEKSNE